MQPQPARSNQEEQAWRLSRRQALIAIAGAGLSLPLLAHLEQEEPLTPVVEEFLPRCAAGIAACQHLSKGSDLAIAEHMLSQYLPKLETVAQRPSKDQKEAASLASQGYHLAGILELQRNRLDAREAHCIRAIQYGQLAEDINLQVVGLSLLAGTYYHSKHLTKKLQTYQRALLHIKEVSPLLQGRVYLGLAEACASCGQDQEARRYLGLAYEVFPEHPEHDPGFPIADCGLSSLYLWGGLTRTALDEPEEAWNAFEQVQELQPMITVPERIRLTIINHQAETALSMRDLDRFCAYIAAGAAGAKALDSEKRYQEAFDVYKQGRSVWPRETRVRALGDLFVR